MPSNNKPTNYKSRIIYSIAFAAVIYVFLSIWSNTSSLKASLASFEWKLLPLLLLMSFTNYIVRFGNWQLYLKILAINVNRKDSFLIHLSGLSMSITPGKVGEVIKSYLLKEKYGIGMSRTASIVFVDRLTDLLALIIIAIIGAAGFHYGQKLTWIIGLIVLVIVYLISNRSIAESLLRVLTKLSFFANRSVKLRNLYESSYNLLRPKNLLFIMLISIAAWSFEAVEFYLVFVFLGIKVSILSAIFIYSFATIVGAVSTLPGGLGLTEGTIAGLLTLLHVPRGPAAAATLIIRATTLWFGVVVGSIALTQTQRNQQ